MTDGAEERTQLRIAIDLERAASKLCDLSASLWDTVDRCSADIIANHPPRSICGELSEVHSLCKQLDALAGELAASQGEMAPLRQDLADLAKRFACPLKDVCSVCFGRGCQECHWVSTRSDCGKYYAAIEDKS
jgi:hypothetical protein